MERSRGRTSAWVAGLFLAWLLLPQAATAQQVVPVTVELTELWQLSSVDDLPPNLGDLFPEVTINGTGTSNSGFICNNPGLEGFILPKDFFTEDGGVDASCSGVPWTFTVDVPVADFAPDGIPIRIKIIDEDELFNDDVETIDLVVFSDGTWTGAADWPDNCNKEVAVFSGARVCWKIDGPFDSDGDGLLDEWERNGLDVDGDGFVDLDLPGMGANPSHKDLFVELDWRPGFPPQRDAVQRWKEAFAAAPIDAGGIPNPDGHPGIVLHVDTGVLTEGGLPVGDNLGGGNALPPAFSVCSIRSSDPRDFSSAKGQNFDEATRNSVFRYGITATRCCLFGTNYGLPCSSDAECAGAVCQNAGGEAIGNDFVVWNTTFQGSTLMHELGHTLDLLHGGNVVDNCKPNYVSIMNYDHFEIERLDGSSILDFSPPRQPNGARGAAPLGPLAENALDETAILDPTDTQNFLAFTDANQQKRRSLIGAPVNWNGDGVTGNGPGTVNIDLADASTGFPTICNSNSNREIRTAANPLTGYDDWTSISLPITESAGSGGGQVDPEPTDAEILGNLEALNTADLSLVKSGPPGPYEAGAEVDLSYLVQVTNQGPNPALVLLVRDTLPPGALLLAQDPACSEGPDGTLACQLGALLPGETADVAFSVRARAGCANGAPVPIVNQAIAENGARYAGADPDPTDNAGSVSTAVVDTKPPELALSASPSQIWAPNHRFVPITITPTATDVCDDSPAIRLVSITSDEAANEQGDGNTSPDVEGAAFGTDDRTFSLRAERSGNGSGRVYTITYEAEDGSGNVTASTTTVTVAKSQKNP